MVKRGHAIGNHTYTHPRDFERSTPSQVIKELEKCEEVIERLTGHRAKLASGRRAGCSTGRCWPSPMRKATRPSCGRSRPTTTMPPPRRRWRRARVLRKVHPGSIILAHDGTFPLASAMWRPPALIVAGLQKRGYHFVTVPEFVRPGPERGGAEARLTGPASQRGTRAPSNKCFHGPFDEQAESHQVVGVVESVRHHNPQDGWTVARVHVTEGSGEGELVSCVGCLAEGAGGHGRPTVGAVGGPPRVRRPVPLLALRATKADDGGGDPPLPLRRRHQGRRPEAGRDDGGGLRRRHAAHPGGGAGAPAASCPESARRSPRRSWKVGSSAGRAMPRAC